MANSAYAFRGCALIVALSSAVASADVELFVTKTGRDDQSGAFNQPMATLTAARDRLREIRKERPQEAFAATIWVGAGTYFLQDGLHLEQVDSGMENAPVVYRAKEGEQVTLTGAVELSTTPLSEQDSLWKVLSPQARSNVRVASTHSLGFIAESQQNARGSHRPLHPSELEVFQGDSLLRVAQWPNEGWARTKQVVGKDRYTADLPQMTHAEDRNVWARGFWGNDDTDAIDRVEIDSDRNEVQVLERADAGDLRADARFRLLNLPSQLDAPGEWWLDRENKRLYVWPVGNRPIYAAVANTIVSAYSVSNVQFHGFTLEGALVSGVEIAGGTNVAFEGCSIRHIGNLGVHMYYGEGHSLVNCHLSHIGEGGVRVEGGDRQTLEACRHLIRGNTIQNYSTTTSGWRPGVFAVGVGCDVMDNEIANSGGPGILLHGNNHKVRRNRLHHLCTDTSDVGAVYIGGDPTHRGNVIADNHIHDLGGFGFIDVIAIYLDDFASGTSVSSNRIERAGRAVAIGGGRDNRVEGNVIRECMAGVQIDGRGTTWLSEMLDGTDSPVAKQIAAVPSEVYTQHYPELASFLTDRPGMPIGNQILNNDIEGRHAVELLDGLDRHIVTVERNRIGGLPYVSDATRDKVAAGK